MTITATSEGIRARVEAVASDLRVLEERQLEGPDATSETWTYPYATPVPVLTPDAWSGVLRLLDDYAHVEHAGAVLLAYTPDCREVAAWLAVALEDRCAVVEIVAMRTLLDDSFPGHLATALGRLPTDRPATVLTFEAHTMSHGHALRSALADWGHDDVRVFRATSAGADLFTHALAVGPEELDARNRALLAQLTRADRLHVTTAGGTDLHVQLDTEKFRWISNSGVWRHGSFVVLPAGEVATYPASVNGRLVADFAIHANVPIDLDTRLHATPVIVDLVDSVVDDFRCANRDLTDLLTEWFASPYVDRVGEVGFGTNFGIIGSVAANSHVNERNPGVHLGFGHHHQSRAVVGYDAEIHIDLIAADGRVAVGEAHTIDLRDRSALLMPFEPAIPEYEIEDVR